MLLLMRHAFSDWTGVSEIKFGALMDRVLDDDASFLATGVSYTVQPRSMQNNRIITQLTIIPSDLDRPYIVGHYARIVSEPMTGMTRLYHATDAGKDQSYFLSACSEAQLARVRVSGHGLTQPFSLVVQDLNAPSFNLSSGRFPTWTLVQIARQGPRQNL